MTGTAAEPAVMVSIFARIKGSSDTYPMPGVVSRATSSIIHAIFATIAGSVEWYPSSTAANTWSGDAKSARAMMRCFILLGSFLRERFSLDHLNRERLPCLLTRFDKLTIREARLADGQHDLHIVALIEFAAVGATRRPHDLFVAQVLGCLP